MRDAPFATSPGFLKSSSDRRCHHLGSRLTNGLRTSVWINAPAAPGECPSGAVAYPTGEVDPPPRDKASGRPSNRYHGRGVRTQTDALARVARPSVSSRVPREIRRNCNRHGYGVVVATWQRDPSGPARRHARRHFHGNRSLFGESVTRWNKFSCVRRPFRHNMARLWVVDCIDPMWKSRRRRIGPGLGSGRESG